VLEALISGTPVIASTGTPWESLEENHFGYWLPWDIKNWKNGILTILNDGSYKSDVFLKHTRQWVIDNFNWSNVVDRYIELYKEIQNRR
jgi:glycosyltransferase involved in cell wall biosynthesis